MRIVVFTGDFLREIFMRHSILSSFHDLHTTISNEETHLRDFFVILKHSLQNYQKVSKEYNIWNRFKSSNTHWCVTRHENYIISFFFRYQVLEVLPTNEEQIETLKDISLLDDVSKKLVFNRL